MRASRQMKRAGASRYVSASDVRGNIQRRTCFSARAAVKSSVGTFAITGVAAIGIDGATFAHLTYQFQKRGSTKWQGLRLLIIVKISMVTNKNLYDLDRFCRAFGVFYRRWRSITGRAPAFSSLQSPSTAPCFDVHSVPSHFTKFEMRAIEAMGQLMMAGNAS